MITEHLVAQSTMPLQQLLVVQPIPVMTQAEPAPLRDGHALFHLLRGGRVVPSFTRAPEVRAGVEQACPNLLTSIERAVREGAKADDKHQNDNMYSNGATHVYLNASTDTTVPSPSEPRRRQPSSTRPLSV